MRGTAGMTIGERIAWYRRRRGMSQEVLAGLVGRSADWLSKVENNRLPLDRLSVIKAVAEAIDVSIGDLLSEPSLVDWSPETGRRTVSALRDLLLDYGDLMTIDHQGAPATMARIDALAADVARLWDAYQDARFGYVVGRLPWLLSQTRAAAHGGRTTDRPRAHRLLALSYQLASVQLTKFGEAELAWIAADRGLVAAQTSGDPAVTGSLARSVVHALLSAGRYAQAVRLTEDAANTLRPLIRSPSAEGLSVYGTLFLAGSMAAARADDRDTARRFLAEAGAAADQLGSDANCLWTSFGPTNVAIHRVATAAELGDLQVAIDLGPRVDTSPLPKERRVRHALEVARALSGWNRVEHAQAVLLDAERLAPEQVRYHYLGRQLVLGWMRRCRGRPSPELLGLARRLNVID